MRLVQSILPVILVALGACVTAQGKPIYPDEQRHCPSDRLLISKQEHDQRQVQYRAAVIRENVTKACLDHLLKTAIYNYRAAGGK